MRKIHRPISVAALKLFFALACTGLAISPAIVAGQEDPLVSISYGLEVEGRLSGLFAWVEGIGSESEVMENKVIGAGPENVRVEKLPGRLTWTGIALSRNISSNTDIWEWRKMVEEGDVDNARSNVSIIAYNQSGEEITRWNFENAWPSKISAPAGLRTDTGGVETITIVHSPTSGIDKCPDDPFKTEAGVCGCGIADTDSNNDGSEDCKPLIMRSGFEGDGIPPL